MRAAPVVLPALADRQVFAGAFVLAVSAPDGRQRVEGLEEQAPVRPYE